MPTEDSLASCSPSALALRRGRLSSPLTPALPSRRRRRRLASRGFSAAALLVGALACALGGRPALLLPVARAQSPSPAATPLPSDPPSRVPSRTPTPVAATSGEPTPQPTPRPSNGRSRVPTQKPTSMPSDRPSLIPTRRRRQPTAVPTPTPTPDPTGSPTTASPTESPTETRAPTTFTPKPTVSPAPTGTPTESPTPEPTEQPVTARPTPAPTFLKVTDTVSVVMTLRSVTGPFENRTEVTFEAETGIFVKTSIQTTQVSSDAPLTFLDVDANVAQQRTLSSSSSSGRRQLQQSSSNLVPLQVSVDVTVEYRSNKTDYSAKLWVGEAFNSPDKREAYLERLRGTGDPAFENLQSVDVLVDGTAPIEQPDTPTPSDGNNTGTLIAIILGSVVGGVIVVALLVYGIRNARDNDKRRHGARPPTATTGSHQTPLSSDQKLATEILVEGYQDDVSTLGDPVGWTYGGAGGTIMEERTASVGPGALGDLGDDDDEDYRPATATLAGATTASNSKGRTEDDESFERQYGLDEVEVGDGLDDDDGDGREERFEVEAPAGKLGMVIDTPGGGVPVVHALKGDSVLSGAVQVGDRLLYVDTEDVTGMTALQVSKLISLKADQPRALVFARRRGATDPPASE